MNCIDQVVGVVAGEDEPAVVLELFDERTERFLGVLGEVVCFVEEDDFGSSKHGGGGGELSNVVSDFTNSTIK